MTGEPTVTVGKVPESKGDRLAIAVEETDQRITLDAIALEALTWQDSSFVADLDTDSPYDPDADGGTITADDDQLQMINEYAQIQVDVAGEAFLVRDPGEGTEIELSPSQLAVLAAEGDIDFVTEILSEMPFGPSVG